MKFLLSTFILLAFAKGVYAQKEMADLPIDSATRKIRYTEVVMVDSPADQQELFSRARDWFARTYKSPKSVIRKADPQNGMIVGKASMQVYRIANGSNFPNGFIHYTIAIYLEKGGYRYEIVNFYHTGQAGVVPAYGACEDMINTKKKTMGVSNQKIFNSYLSQMDANIKDLIVSLKTNMNRIAPNPLKE